MAEHTLIPTPNRQPRLVLIAHDHYKPKMLEWAKHNLERLKEFDLFATGTTGSLIENNLGVRIHKFKSGPLGGDQQIGAKLAEGELDMIVFFWDPLSPQPHAEPAFDA
ncbi:MAG: methylglyoxal synthase, partial [Proteobacteria bacterium]